MDGVLVDTIPHHYESWRLIAEELNIPFDETVNEKLRGLSRLKSLNLLLSSTDLKLTAERKVEYLEIKNVLYLEIIDRIEDKKLLDGVGQCLEYLKSLKIPMALGSASANARAIHSAYEMEEWISIVVDRNDVKKTKPDPEVFLLCAQKLGVDPGTCLVVEDSPAGVKAALSAGMQVISLGDQARHYKSIHCTKSQDLLGVLRQLTFLS